MKKSILYCLLFFSLAANGQIAPFNPAKAYLNDTTGFTAYPDVLLLQNLQLPIKYKRLEINTWITLYRPKTPILFQCQHRNLYRYPAIAHPVPDTMVLSKCDLKNYFIGNYGPELQPWYISAQTTKDQIVTVTDTVELRVFLGDTDDKFNAYLWLLHIDITAGTPIRTDIGAAQYKKVPGGTLIKYSSREDFGPINDDDPKHHAGVEAVFFVDNNFSVVLVRKKNIHSDIVYKL